MRESNLIEDLDAPPPPKPPAPAPAPTPLPASKPPPVPKLGRDQHPPPVQSRYAADYRKWDEVGAEKDAGEELMEVIQRMYVNGDVDKKKELEEAHRKAQIKMATKGPMG